MGTVTVEGTVVQEFGEGMVRVRVTSPDASELSPEQAVGFKLDGASRVHPGTVLTVHDENELTALIDRVAIDERMADVEDLDRIMSKMPSNVRAIRGMEVGGL